MAQKKAAQQLSKILTYVLGNRPDEFGLVPDPDGFVKIKDLLKAISEDKELKTLRMQQINEICLTTSNPPFEIISSTIRAKNREKLFVPKKIAAPPKLLFTCIRKKAYIHVASKGIQPAGYSQVILSSSEEMAARIGRRSDPDPVLLRVLVQKSMDEGIIFYQAGETLFTAAYIPATCFTGPSLPKEKAPAKSKKVKPAKSEVPVSYLFDLKQMEQNDEKLRLKRKREKNLRGKNMKRARKQKKSSRNKHP